MPPTMPRARRASVSRCRIEQMTARRELAELQRLPRAGNDWRLLQDIASVALACDRRDLQLHSAQALIVRDYLEQPAAHGATRSRSSAIVPARGRWLLRTPRPGCRAVRCRGR